MDAKLRQLLEQFEEDMSWSGMEVEDLTRVTLYTLRTLSKYLEGLQPPAKYESSLISGAIEVIGTFLSD